MVAKRLGRDRQVRSTTHRAGNPGGTEGTSVRRSALLAVLRRESWRPGRPRRKPLSSHICCGSSEESTLAITRHVGHYSASQGMSVLLLP